MSSEQPIPVFSGKEYWVVYPEDNAYQRISSLPRDGEGVVHIESSELEQLKGWWYDKATERVDQEFQKFAISWDTVRLSEREARESSPSALSEKLAHTANLTIPVRQELGRLDARIHLAKVGVEQAVNKRLALEKGSGPLGPRIALMISSNRTLRSAKLDVWEMEGLRGRLNGVLDSLDLNWKTISRVLSAKLREPLD